MDGHDYQDELRALAFEARADDYESLATRMEAGEWRASK